MTSIQLSTGKITEFIWGKVIKVHYIGYEYDVVEYHPRKVKEGRILNEIDFQIKEYHGYVKEKDTSCSWKSFDEAIIGCIAYKYEGANHRADEYFIKMIQ